MTKRQLMDSAMDLVDALVELYLAHVIKPFLKLHERFYSKLNAFLRGLLDENKSRIPDWFTANFITYVRTLLVIPTVLLLAAGHSVLPSFTVLLVDFGDFLDGVVARYWVDVKKERAEKEAKKPKKEASSAQPKKQKDPSSSDDDSYEVVTSGSQSSVPSWTMNHRSRNYGGFVDAVCDKAFVIPCWIFLMSTVPGTQWSSVQFIVLWCLVLAETASGCIRFRAYFTAGGVPAPAVSGLDFSTSAVKADHIGKAKQTFEMVGTTLFILPSFARYLGLLFLTAAVPLAYESVRRKVKKRIMYVSYSGDEFDHSTLKFWMQAKGMGSKLIVGVLPGDESQKAVMNACSSSSVDSVIVEAPPKADLHFLEKHGIDYVVATGGQEGLVTEMLMNANRCLLIRPDGTAQPMKPKELHKD